MRQHTTNWPAALIVLVFIASWVFGIAVALSKGFWITVAAIFIPPVGWVLLAQKALGLWQ